MSKTDTKTILLKANIKVRGNKENILQKQAIQKLNQLSDIDMKLIHQVVCPGFDSWEGKGENKENEVKKEGGSKIKFRGFSFWKRTNSRGVEEIAEKKQLSERRNSINLNIGRLYRTNTQVNGQKVSSNAIFVRKYPIKDKSSEKILKTYLLNNILDSQSFRPKNKSFQSQSRTVIIKRPKTGSSQYNVRRLQNDNSKKHFRNNSNDQYQQLQHIIAQSQKLVRKTKRYNPNKKLQRDIQNKNALFFNMLKQKYKSYVYAPQLK